MRFPHPTRMNVTRRGEKQLRLGAFIARGLDGLPVPAEGGEEQSAERAVLLMARSAQSPAVRAVAALAREIAAAGCSLRIILVKADHAGMSAALGVLRTTAVDCEVRLARNPRLIEAHEQLTIGACVAWTGDTMRRDPATCDAYESYAEDCPQIAAAAAVTFARLWQDCAPLAAGTAPMPAVTMETPKQVLPASLLARRS